MRSAKTTDKEQTDTVEVEDLSIPNIKNISKDDITLFNKLKVLIYDINDRLNDIENDLDDVNIKKIVSSEIESVYLDLQHKGKLKDNINLNNFRSENISLLVVKKKDSLNEVKNTLRALRRRLIADIQTLSVI